MIFDKYRSLRRAALRVAYDNGMINRYQTEEQFLDGAEEAVGADGVYNADLAAIDAALASLTSQELDDLCSGGEEEKYAVLAKFDRDLGEKIDGILDDIFDAP